MSRACPKACLSSRFATIAQGLLPNLVVSGLAAEFRCSWSLPWLFSGLAVGAWFYRGCCYGLVGLVVIAQCGMVADSSTRVGTDLAIKGC